MQLFHNDLFHTVLLQRLKLTFRPCRSTSCMRPTATDGVARSVSRSVMTMSTAKLKSGLTDHAVVWDADSCEVKEP